jgi:hypothetical protein
MKDSLPSNHGLPDRVVTSLVAAKEVHTKLSEVSELVQRIRFDVNALAQNHDLQNLLRQEETWLQQAERTVREVQRWRDLEAYRFWPGVIYRWALAVAFALFAVWAAGAGYAWVNDDHERELAALRSRLEALDFIEQRAATLTPAEQRQLSGLIDWPPRATNEQPGRRSQR